MANGDHSGNPARWLAGILVGIILSALGGLGGVAMRHEGAIARTEERNEDTRKQLDRMERKIDKLFRD